MVGWFKFMEINILSQTYKIFLMKSNGKNMTG